VATLLTPTDGWTPAPTATGLTREQLRSLSEDEAAALAGWHATKTGEDEGRAWWPWAIRSMPLDARMHLASDPLADAVWEARERSYVIADPVFFINGYGHVQAPDGPPVPFRLWPEQEDVLAVLIVAAILVMLKARQLGLTWIALHYAAWLLAFCSNTPRARILLLSKGLEEAKILLRRMRRILKLLPPFLRPQESQRTGEPGEAVAELDLVGRGSVRSLPASAKAARMETVTFALADEAAFMADFQSTWQALLSTVGTTGQVAVVSTGNGPAEAEGEGQAYAKLWERASAGDVEVDDAGVTHGMSAIFLPDNVHPDRTEEWRAAKRREFLSDEDFYAEHPESEEQALTGRLEGKVYSPAGINAAERLGRQFDMEFEAGTLRLPVGGLLRTGSDYGAFTHHLIGWPLEGGGVYIMREVVGGGAHGKSVRETTLDVCRALDDCQYMSPARGARDVVRWPLAGGGLYDASAPDSNGTFREVIHANVPLYPRREFPDRSPLQEKTRTLDVWYTVATGAGRRIRTRGVPFGGAALGRGRSLKDSMVDYARELFRRTADAEQGDRDPVGLIAISPNCPVLLRQLRGLETKTDGTGRIEKGNDHGPDAMLTLQLPDAAAYHGVVLDEDTDA
jgi:hypothetical protein